MDFNLALQIDGFLHEFDAFRKHCDQLTYEPVTNPRDGVVYPGICRDVPLLIKEQIVKKMHYVTDKKLCNTVAFLRLSLLGDKAPHEAHTDAVMGDIGAIVYITRKRYCRGGTAFIQHKNGMRFNPETQADANIWEKDHNNYDQWEILQNISMEQNRGFIFNTHCFHRAEKPQSFGSNAENGRLALICFASFDDGKNG